MVMKKSCRGSVGRAFRGIKRYQEDEEFKKRQLGYTKEWQQKNKDKMLRQKRERIRILSEFKNKRCKKCNKILDYKTKGDYCHKHIWLKKKK